MKSARASSNERQERSPNLATTNTSPLILILYAKTLQPLIKKYQASGEAMMIALIINFRKSFDDRMDEFVPESIRRLLAKTKIAICLAG